jgi:outer membrane immunogenic protein
MEAGVSRVFVVLLALAAMALPATAADLRLPTKAPAIATPIYNWTGFYAGLNAGYTWAQDDRFNANSTAGPCDPASGGGCTAPVNYSALSATAATFSQPAQNSGFIGGFQLGYNWQTSSNFVAGLEADLQGTIDNKRFVTFNSVVPSPFFPAFPLTQTATVGRGLDYLATFRGRVGVLAAPTLLLYGTGGLAVGGVSTSATIAQTCTGCVFTNVPGTAGSSSQVLVGWTAGAGGEWLFAPKWSAKLEYLYYDLGTARHTLPTLQGFDPALFMSSTTVTSNRFDGHVARVGINYHLN